MLKNNVIIYDHECPMCAVYTGAFVKFELLDKEGRFKFADLQHLPIASIIDKDRARHEIALIDIEKKEVRYGLESLFYILGTRFPFLHLIFKQKWFQLFMQPLYYFISYNRKVIAPSSTQNSQSCNPDFHLKYRVLYILLMMYVVGVFAFSFGLFPIYWAYWAIQVLFSILYFSKKGDMRKSIAYLGHQITILLIGCLLLIPSMFLSNLLVYNLIIVGLVIGREYWRRWKAIS
jgi:predicted DCC family thiol-disulfide oxidoreductase YuxK